MEKLSSVYEPKAVEGRWYEHWRSQGFFQPADDPERPPFTVVLPPPNVTGRLHMGHALTATIEDCLVRWRRMSGCAALWLPGTDHAGIATQVMVERALEAEGTSRQAVGRDGFLQRVWQWKEEHGGIIDRQHERLGASLDWSRYRFTMDEVSSRAVREAFCRLYEQGLIYRAHRLINWDWASRTALSDLEVDAKEVSGKLWHIAYPVEGTDATLVVATTRPETMLGDTAVAVHPDDPRYRHLVGKRVRLPLTDRTIPVIGDPILVDMEFGTGAVKVTPAHDFNDFETGQRHDLEVLCVIGFDGKINDNAPTEFRGLSVAEARERVVDALQKQGALVEIRDHQMVVGFSSRNPDVAVEPLPSTQWFVKVGPLAEPALEAVKQGKTRILPEHRTADYYRWMENIHDWCISRQLWWGHRIPAWHCHACQQVTVAREAPETCKHCEAPALEQDEDVLDTWFSSGLWPLTTLGWPDRRDDLQRFYPTSLLETGYDILFFWVARMMMFGLHFGGDVPFRTVFLHSMVLGEDGQKMSKTRGNVVDPIGLIDEYGSDALRYYLCTMAGQDAGIVFDRSRVEGYRHFCNKLWNAARFALMNLEGYQPEKFTTELLEEVQFDRLSIADRWILARAVETACEVDELLESYRLDLAAHRAYQFVWYELCDWYLELAKLPLRSEHEARRYATQGTLATVLDMVLRMLHPMIPFITEELWSRLPKPHDAAASLMVAEYPRPRARTEQGAPTLMAGPLVHVGELLSDSTVLEAREAVKLLMDTVTAARSLRAQFRVPPSQRVVLKLRVGDEATAALVHQVTAEVSHLARLERLELLERDAEVPREAATEVVGGLEVILPLAGLVDIGEERQRIAKELEKLTRERDKLQRKLGNEQFRTKAPSHVVAKDEARLEELGTDLGKLRGVLARLGG